VAASATSPPPDPPPEAPAGLRPRRHADAIYGTIITASVFASAGDELATGPLAISVLITLAVYWIADVYAELLGDQLARKRLPTWLDIRSTLASSWPMVSATFSPLLVLFLAWVAGASSSVSATAGLVAAIVILAAYAWWACRAAGLRGARMFAVTSVAAVLGLLMIFLKNVVLVQLH
jgi:hypothetical protein